MESADLDHWLHRAKGALIDRPADVLKVWPTREPSQRLPPAQFSPLLDQLVTSAVNYPTRERVAGISFRRMEAALSSLLYLVILVSTR